MGNISYSCILLDKNSQNKLKVLFGQLKPDWKWFGHHMTIKLGELPSEYKDNMGDQVELTGIELGISDKAIALKVLSSGIESYNKIPHVTLLVNTENGGKPKDSNDITEWKSLNKQLKLSGIVTEVPYANKKINEIKNVKDLSFSSDINNNGGKIYQVGGAVRDKLLNKDSKDLDILITGIPSDKLQTILSKHGKVDMVGASFGVIKFKPFGETEDIDIAIPRTEIKKDSGHKGFDVNADHNLPIEKDLERRDFTINSIAKDDKGNLIDPYGGVNDIKNKIIRVTNPIAFSEDPLRMLRAIQFSARFGFTVEPKTFELIKQNSNKIKEISYERILIEFEKLVNKGNPKIGAVNLINSGLYESLFDSKFKGDVNNFDNVSRVSEFIFILLKDITNNPSEYYKNTMKGDIATTNELKTLSLPYNNPITTKTDKCWLIFNINKISPVMLNSKLLTPIIGELLNDFNMGKYPYSFKDLAVNGNDLMNIGITGKMVGNALKNALNAIYSDKLNNDKINIINFLNKNINETFTKKELLEMSEKTVYFIDFDGCIMDSPLPEYGKIVYEKKTGNPYPHKGWWSKPESLDINIFDIKTNKEIENIYHKIKNDPNAYTVLLTNRLQRLSEAVKKVLAKHNLTFDAYSFKNDAREKGERMLDIMQTNFPNIKNIVFYDDDQRHLDNVKMVMKDTDYNIELHKVSSDNHYLNQND